VVQAIGLLLPASLGPSITIGGIALTNAAGALTIAGTLLNTVAGLAINAALAPRPEAPVPQDQQRALQQSTGPRVVHVGRNRVAGTRVFLRSKGGFVYQLIVHGASGPYRIDGVYVDNEPVTLDAEGYVTDERYQQGGRSLLRILTRTGEVPSAHYQELTDVFPEWTANHRLDSLCTSLMIREQGRADQYASMWPSDPPTVSLEIHGPQVVDPRDDVSKFTANASASLGAFAERHLGLEGFIDQDFLKNAVDVDDVQVITPEGAEPRWELHGSYNLTEDPRTIFRQWMEAYGMDIRFLPSGKMALLPGTYEEPTVVYTMDDILAVHNVDNGPGQLSVYTQLPWTYVDHDLNYLATSGARYVDDDLEAFFGRAYTARETGAFEQVGTHWRGQRAARVRTRRDNPKRTIALQLREAAIRGHLERYVRLDVPQASVAGVYRVTASNFDIETGAVTQTLEAMDTTTFDFAVDEYEPRQELPADQEETVIAELADFAVGAEGTQVAQNALSAGIRASWTGPNIAPYIPRIEISEAGRNQWTVAPSLDEDSLTHLFAPLTDGSAYDIRGAYQTIAGEIGEYTTFTNVIARAATTTPQPPTAISATDQGSGNALVSLTAWDEMSLWKTAIKRDGVEITRFVSAPGEEFEIEDQPGAGTYDYTATSINVSGDESAPTSVQTVTVT